MNLVIGTAKGVFVADGHGRVKAAAGVEQRSLRHLSRMNGDLLAGTDDGVARSSDGGLSWRPSGIAGFFVWDVAAAPDDPHTLFAVTEPAALFRSSDGGRSWVEIDVIPAGPRRRRVVPSPYDHRGPGADDCHRSQPARAHG